MVTRHVAPGTAFGVAFRPAPAQSFADTNPSSNSNLDLESYDGPTPRDAEGCAATRRIA
jgi:hypothetical protein